ncbi:MAG: hypothetical protein H6867_06560 [Rhodospirillales bacterium]|nr:hypothetical protein [Rhodospirillales bacterium]MCB9995210.1 hypothetical protein [Rhodospirillales bacterium]
MPKEQEGFIRLLGRIVCEETGDAWFNLSVAFNKHLTRPLRDRWRDLVFDYKERRERKEQEQYDQENNIIRPVTIDDGIEVIPFDPRYDAPQEPEPPSGTVIEGEYKADSSPLPEGRGLRKLNEP